MVAVVEDYDRARKNFTKVLAVSGAKAAGFGSAEELDLSEDKLLGFESYLLDARLPGRSGIDLAVRIRSLDPSKLILIVSGHEELRREALDVGIRPEHVFDKPLLDGKDAVKELVLNKAQQWEVYVESIVRADAHLINVIRGQRSTDGHSAFVALKRYWRENVTRCLLGWEMCPRVGAALEIDRLIYTRSFFPSVEHRLEKPTVEELRALRAVFSRTARRAFSVRAQQECTHILEEAGWTTGLEIPELR